MKPETIIGWLIANGWLCTDEGWLHPNFNKTYPMTYKQAIVSEYINWKNPKS